MARTRQCQLCGAEIKANVAAHVCPHDRPCRYLCGADGMPVDWASPECEECRETEISAPKQMTLVVDTEDWDGIDEL